MGTATAMAQNKNIFNNKFYAALVIRLTFSAQEIAD